MIATGKLKVTCGIRLPRTALAETPPVSLLLLSSAPQTRQRVASSLTRVPQVGHNFVFLGELSVIGVLKAAKDLVQSRKRSGDYTSLSYWLPPSRQTHLLVYFSL
ncbi:MAG TPA: hypothetical protein DEH22_14470 [Chloroflexi bacterium]|nr:hypothetical protein [Chloroflexota bacterium]